MGFVVDADENDHDIAFDIRRHSVIFYADDDEPVEISKDMLKKIQGLLSDPAWSFKLTKE